MYGWMCEAVCRLEPAGGSGIVRRVSRLFTKSKGRGNRVSGQTGPAR